MDVTVVVSRCVVLSHPASKPLWRGVAIGIADDGFEIKDKNEEVWAVSF
jgi:hypothetical protein